MVPALLALVSVGSAAMARVAIGELLPWMFASSVGFLAYAHYLTWVRRHGHPASRVVLLASTPLVVSLWYSRLQLWVERWLS